MTREAFEAALDTGQLWTRVQSRDGNKWYLCRRNGRTRTWKREPDRFSIPVKFRFRDTMRVEFQYPGNTTVDSWFYIGEDKPT